MRNMMKTLTALFLVWGSAASAATLPAGFSESLVAGGMTNPTAMAIAPDGRIFVCLQAGDLRVIKAGALLPAPALSLSVNSLGERGLLGVAFDPAFTVNHFIYLYYTATSPAVHNRVSRFTVTGDTASAASELALLDLENLSATNHNGGALHFGPDGKLYIAVGENAVGANAQTLSNKLGKILRINPDGSIPSDNPFFGTASGSMRSIWALGLRNPFTFSFQNGSGRLFINDVGESSWEEVNAGAPGSNYGWPDTEGMTSNPAFESPLYAYDHSGGACAIVGSAFYNPASPSFPPAYAGRYFFGDLCSGEISTLLPPSYTAAIPFADGVNSLVDLKVGDAGELYYLQRGGGGELWRVQPAAAPSPSATRTAAPLSSTATVTATRTATALSATATVTATRTQAAVSPTATVTATRTSSPLPLTSTATRTATATPSPAAPLGQAVPGRIEAEDYRTGGEGVGYHDSTPGNTGGQYRSDNVDIEAATDLGGGFDVAYITAGEWLSYNVNVASSGSYQLSARVASGVGGTKGFHVEVDGVDVTGPVTFINAGGWQNWRTVVKTGVPLSAGSHTLRLFFDTTNFNVNWIQLDGPPASPTASPTRSSTPSATQSPSATRSRTATPSPTASPTLVVMALPGRLQAEDYRPGGEGFGYHDSTAGNAGGQYRSDNVDIEAATDTGGGYDVAYVTAGEWLGFNVNVAAAGSYQFSARVASAVGGTKTLHVEVDGVNVTGPVSFTNAGGWQSWNTAVKAAVPLSAGLHTLKVFFDTTNINLNWVEFAAPATTASATASATQSATATRTASSTATATSSPTAGSLSATASATRTATASATRTPALSSTASPTAALSSTASATRTATPAVTGTPVLTPVVYDVTARIEAENYRPGGEGVGYHDTSPGNAGGQYRSDDVDIEASSDAGGGFDVTSIGAGEWLGFDVFVPAAGPYSLKARVASAVKGVKTFHIEVDGVDVSGPVTFHQAQGWQKWHTDNTPNIVLPAGRHLMRVVFDSGNMNLNWFRFRAAGGGETPTATETPALSASPSATPTTTGTRTPSFTATGTALPLSGTATVTASSTRTATPTASTTAAVTSAPSGTETPALSATPSRTASPSRTATPSFTDSPTATPDLGSPTATPTRSSTMSPSVTPTPSGTPGTPSATSTPSDTRTATLTSTESPTVTVTATHSPSPLNTATRTPQPSATATPHP
jgi:glucose/arabinose dehydrogenase